MADHMDIAINRYATAGYPLTSDLQYQLFIYKLSNI